MAVYVDPLMWHGWRMYGRQIKSCHLFTDGEMEELHLFAQKIGLKRSWFHDKPGSVSHYDLTERSRRIAVAHGAVQLDCAKAGEMFRFIRGTLL